MSASSAYFYNADGELCIDPKKLVYETGRGANDPYYNNQAALPRADESFDLDLDEYARQQLHAHGPNHGYGLGLQLIQEQDYERRATPSTPKNPPHSSLNAEALTFVPKSSPPRLSLNTATRQGAGAVRSTGATPLTPDITISAPQDACSDSASVPQQHGRQTALNRRHSSPGHRPSPLVGRRAQSRPGRGRSSANMYLSPITPQTPEAWVMRDSYHIGDRVANMRAPQTGFETFTPVSTLSRPPSAPSSQTSGGYRCDFPGCKKPDKIFPTQSACNHHKRSHKSESERPHRCPACGKGFHDPKDVRRHFKAVHERVQVTCHVCGKVLSRGDNLERHMASQHKHGMPTPTSADRTTAASPSGSSVASFAQTSYSGTVPSTPLTYSPLLPAQAATFSLQQRLQSSGSMSGMEDPFVDAVFQAPYFSHPMTKSRSNGV